MEDIAERFARDTKTHEMTVLHDDGLYRHLRFQRPKSSCYWFDLVSWPGHLAFVGDVGAGYVFTRERDMVPFFRNRYGINPGYWAEKLTSGGESVKRYSYAAFRRHIDEAAAEHEDEFPGLTAAMISEVEDSSCEDSEEAAREFLRDFTFNVGKARIGAAWNAIVAARDPDAKAVAKAERDAALKDAAASAYRTFAFSDAWEWNLTDYHWEYLWACHAILWGIGQYDAAKKAPVAPTAVAA